MLRDNITRIHRRKHVYL